MSNKIQISQVQGLENIALDYTAVSGLVNESGNAISGNLIETGTILNSSISTLSGDINSTGTELNTLVGEVSGNLDATGTIFQSDISTLSGNQNVSGNNLLLEDAKVSGTLDTRLISSGSTLIQRDEYVSGTLRSSIDTITGTLADATGDIGEISGAIPVSNLNISINSNNISTISGITDTQGVTLANATGDISTLQSDVSALDTSYISLSGKLLNTGSTLNSRISTVSGNLETTGVTLNIKTNSISGQVATTGADLEQLIKVSLSGALDTTGSNLRSDILTISGNVNTTGTNLKSDISTLSGNLNTTGTTILEKIGYNSTGSTMLGSGSFTTSNIKLQDEVSIYGGLGSYVKIIQWLGSGTSGSYQELYLGGVSGKRAYVPNDTLWHIRLHSVSENTTHGTLGDSAQDGQLSIKVINSGFILHEEQNTLTKPITFEGSENTVGSGDSFNVDIFLGTDINGSYLGVSGYQNGAYQMSGKHHVVAYIHQTENWR